MLMDSTYRGLAEHADRRGLTLSRCLPIDLIHHTSLRSIEYLLEHAVPLDRIQGLYRRTIGPLISIGTIGGQTQPIALPPPLLSIGINGPSS